MRKRPPSFASTPSVRERMQRQARQDTAPEIALRRELHRRGLRYRLHVRPLPDLRRRLDIVFSSVRVAVEVRGCFWHRCPEHGMVPKANSAWWETKLARNAERDAQTEARLAAEGWTVLVVWEHESPHEAADRIAQVVRARPVSRRRR